MRTDTRTDTRPLDKDNGEDDDAQSDRERLANACLEPDLDKRWSKLNQTLDVDRVLSFMAVEVLVDHRDGYSLDRNNFRLYCNPADKKFVFLPHGLDLLFYSSDLAPSRGFSSILTRSILETSQGRAGYDARLKSLAAQFFSDESLLKRVDQIWGEIKSEAPAKSEESAKALILLCYE